MFIGSVQCEVELSQSHPAFESLRFLLVEAEHEVEWEGPVVAVDTVGAQVGDMVVVALAPLGSSVDIPDDLPIEAAVVGVVGSITTPAEDEDEESEEVGRPPRRQERESPERERPARAERPRREARSEEEPRKREPRRPEPRSGDDAEDRGRGRGRGRRRPSDDEAVEPERAAPAPEKPRARTEEPPKPAPERDRAAPSRGGGDAPRGGDDLSIVWDIEDDGEAGTASTKRTSSRRRRR